MDALQSHIHCSALHLQAVLTRAGKRYCTVHGADQACESLSVDRGIKGIPLVFGGDGGQDAHQTVEATDGEFAVLGLDVNHLERVFTTCACSSAKCLCQRCGWDC